MSDAVFQEAPDEIDETWTHGALLGGMVENCYKQIAIADAYMLAGRTLVAEALESREGYDLLYPILFNYRHAVELYLKAILRPSFRSHDLRPLCASLVQYARTVLQADIPESSVRATSRHRDSFQRHGNCDTFGVATGGTR